MGRAWPLCRIGRLRALDAQAVADRLDIPFYALDFEKDFARIIDRFADEYAVGRTPNPCVLCNIWLKFGKLWAYGKQVGADFVATGHYARLATTRRDAPRRPGGGRDEGSILRPVWAEAGTPPSCPPAGGGISKGGHPCHGPGSRPPRTRQAGQPGNLLRAGR